MIETVLFTALGVGLLACFQLAVLRLAARAYGWATGRRCSPAHRRGNAPPQPRRLKKPFRAGPN